MAISCNPGETRIFAMSVRLQNIEVLTSFISMLCLGYVNKMNGSNTVCIYTVNPVITLFCKDMQGQLEVASWDRKLSLVQV